MSETPQQAVVRARGMCGELLNGGRDICILEPGHGCNAADPFEEIDRMLFNAGLLVLAATTKQLRKEADSKIMHARVKLEQLRKTI